MNRTPCPFMQIIEHHFRQHFGQRNCACSLDITGEQPAQQECIDAAQNAPTDRFGQRSAMRLAPTEQEHGKAPFACAQILSRNESWITRNCGPREYRFALKHNGSTIAITVDESGRLMAMAAHSQGGSMCRQLSGYSIVVMLQPSKLARGVRFPLPAPAPYGPLRYKL